MYEELIDTDNVIREYLNLANRRGTIDLVDIYDYIYPHCNLNNFSKIQLAENIVNLYQESTGEIAPRNSVKALASEIDSVDFYQAWLTTI